MLTRILQPHTVVVVVVFCYPGVQHCTMNVHLSHLAFYVKHYGPLWTHSAFAFEDGIGHLVRKAHGTHDIGHQVRLSSECILLGGSYVPEAQQL